MGWNDLGWPLEGDVGTCYVEEYLHFHKFRCYCSFAFLFFFSITSRLQLYVSFMKKDQQQGYCEPKRVRNWQTLTRLNEICNLHRTHVHTRLLKTFFLLKSYFECSSILGKHCFSRHMSQSFNVVIMENHTNGHHMKYMAYGIYESATICSYC